MEQGNSLKVFRKRPLNRPVHPEMGNGGKVQLETTFNNRPRTPLLNNKHP
jgi:hypothetical protein